MLKYIDGLISRVNPIRYKGSHEKMRNLTPLLRKEVIETLCPMEGYDQVSLAGRSIPYRLLSEKALARKRCYDLKAPRKEKNC